MSNALGSVLGAVGIVLLLIVSSPVIAEAQTDWKDRPATTAVDNQFAPSPVRPSQPGFTILVWEDQRNSGTGYDIYMQKIDTHPGGFYFFP